LTWNRVSIYNMGMVTKSFVLAGRASFILANPSGESVTVKISQSREKRDAQGNVKPAMHWVTLRHNNDPWDWVGSLIISQGTIKPKYGSSVNPRILSIANWALDCVWKGLTMPSGYRLEHTGRCGRCGKMLRDAKSIKSGFGPECIKYV